MRMSAMKWSIALAVLTGLCGAAAAQDKSSAALGSALSATTIAIPQLIPSASRPVGVIRSVNAVEPFQGAVKSLDPSGLGKLHRVDRDAVSEKIEGKDAKLKGTKLAANTVDDTPSSQPAVVARAPLPTCR